MTIPATAAAAVGHLTNWGRAQAALMRVPDRARRRPRAAATPEARAARSTAIFEGAAAEGRRDPDRARGQGGARRLWHPGAAPAVARDAGRWRRIAAARCLRPAARLVVKVLSQDITHKSDVGGVVLGIATPARRTAAAAASPAGWRRRAPDARLDGFALQPMIAAPMRAS